MTIPEQQFYEMLDQVVHEGDPDLVLAPLTPATPDLPAAWADVLTELDFHAAIARMWRPMEDRLPRVCRALRERLQGIALLRTGLAPPSLVYIFRSGADFFCYRGRLPGDTAELASSPLPSSFLEFYYIHDGWVSLHAGDDGPLPRMEWLPLTVLWSDFLPALPPGEVPDDQFITVYRDDEELALGYYCEGSAPLPMRIQKDGAAEVILDLWLALDSEVGGFLEELDRATGVRGVVREAHENRSETPKEAFLDHLLNGTLSKSSLRGPIFHAQAFQMYFEKALSVIGGPGAVDLYTKALAEWCAMIELGHPTDPGEVMTIYGLSHALGDETTAAFLSTMPAPLWGDSSLEAHQLHVLFRLFLNDRQQADLGLQELLGLTYDSEKPPDEEDEIVARLLESLFRKERSSFLGWRRRADEKLCSGPNELNARLPWRLRLTAFDAIAYHLGVVEEMITPFAPKT